MEFFLRQQWHDERLRHNSPTLIDGSELETGVWIPDTYFVQSKQVQVSQLVDNSMSIKIRSDGLVLTSSR